MIRTGEEYREPIRDGRQVFMNGEKVEDVPNHPFFQPIVAVRSRMYDMVHEPQYQLIFTFTDAESFTAYTERVHALSNLPAMMQIARELCGGQICVKPDRAAFEYPKTQPWLEKYY